MLRRGRWLRRRARRSGAGGETRDAGCSSRAAGRAAEGTAAVGDLGLRKEPGHSLRCFVEGDGFGAVLEDRAPGGETRDAGCSSRAAGRAAEGTAAVGDLGLRQEPGHSLRCFVEGDGFGAVPEDRAPGGETRDAGCSSRAAGRAAEGGAEGAPAQRPEPGRTAAAKDMQKQRKSKKRRTARTTMRLLKNTYDSGVAVERR
ncbi:unnamed protein product [Prorocentrum cordatum]|uniref:Uncharacterized protein n=1 Tax=Prorocentrum cordatum TaxID=2364126 RepID=A0ABN9QWC4_9DINO|nr:unnamed protein product [Polarella glacialis]